MCAHHCAQLQYTSQHCTVLIIFSLIFQTVVIAQVLSTEGRGRGFLSRFRCSKSSKMLIVIELHSYSMNISFLCLSIRCCYLRTNDVISDIPKTILYYLAWQLSQGSLWLCCISNKTAVNCKCLFFSYIVISTQW